MILNIFICVYIILMIIYSIAQVKDVFLFRIIAKMSCSTSFIVIALWSMLQNQSIGPWFYTILLGLAFSWIGDLFLVLQRRTSAKGRKDFIIGGSSFFVAHLMFVIAYISYNGFKVLPLIFTLLLLLIAIIIGNRLGAKMYYFTFLMLVYGFILSFMVFNSIVFIKDVNIFSVLVLLGSILFFVSDILIYLKFILKFCGKTISVRIANTLSIINTFTYFPAQLLLALTILYI